MPAPTAGGTVQFKVTSDWGSGFNGDITVKNTGTATLSNWSVSFDFAGTISSLWNGTIAGRQGATYTVNAATWNATLAPGASATIGFTASPGGASAVLTNLKLNGVAPAPAPAPPPTPTSPTFAYPPDNQLLRDLWEQLRGPQGQGWPQLGGRSLVDAIAELLKKTK